MKFFPPTVKLFIKRQHIAKQNILFTQAEKKTAEIIIPSSEEEIKQAVLQYEKYLDSIMKEIVSLYKKTFPEGKNSLFVMNEILMILNLVRY